MIETNLNWIIQKRSKNLRKTDKKWRKLKGMRKINKKKIYLKFTKNGKKEEK